jgi:putative FmdB family regulatory protein
MIYEYECDHCKCVFEKDRKVKDRNHIIICPNCHSRYSKLRLSPVAFQLKGDGWARDGYANKTKKL